MAYQFKKSGARKLQEWLEEKIESILDCSDIAVLSRRKGDVENDIENALASLGLAVVVSPYLVTKYGGLATILRADEGRIAISVVENVALNTLSVDGVEIHAETILEAIASSLYDERYLGAPILFDAIEDASPADEPVLTLVQPLKISIDL